MVAMAGDSYLLKVPTPPCQASHACKKGQARPTSCGVVVSMVLLLAAVLALGGVAYHLRLQLCTLREEVGAAVSQRDSDVNRRIEFLYAQMAEMDTKLSRLNTFQQIKTFEAEASIAGADLGTEDVDDVEDEDDGKDDLLPFYDETEQDFRVENRVNDEAKDRPSNVPRLEPAGSLLDRPTPIFRMEEDDIDLDVQPATPAGAAQDQQPAEHHRERREVASASADNLRAQPQLKLYHMLQNPGLSAAAPAEPWSYHGSRRPDHYPQPMYAEHAPTDFVTPPRRHTATATPATPIASRRSRVMDAGNPHEAAPRQRHRNRAGRRQQQLQQQQHGDAQLRLQDVSQDAGRSVEVRRYDGQHGQQQDAPRRGPASSHGGPYWRGARSIDSTVEVAQTWRPYAPVVVGPAIAAHFVANTSRPEHRRHPHRYHHDGFGRHQHEEGLYADWTASAWLQDLGLDDHFDVSDSQIAIRTPGLYLVYAQVNYANEKEENGFWVVRNGGANELLCYVSVSSPDGATRANTCFTAGVLSLAKGDRLAVRDLAGGRYRVLDHAGRSFVGLVNLSACKPKSE